MFVIAFEAAAAAEVSVVFVVAAAAVGVVAGVGFELRLVWLLVAVVVE